MFSNKNEKVVGLFKLKSKNIRNDEFFCLRSKMYSFECGDDIKKTECFSISQTKHIKFQEHKKCLDGQKYEKERESYFLKTINYEKFLQKMKKNLHYLFSIKNDVI